MTRLLLSTALFFTATFALAHGEDRHGPHGGFIRMPGAYHTEVVPQGEGTLEVYLLDMEWKNPVVKDSSVEAEIRGGKDPAAKAKCRAGKSSFRCEFPKGANTRGPGRELVLSTVRAKQKGNTAVYELPFKLAAPAHPAAHDDPHAGH